MTDDYFVHDCPRKDRVEICDNTQGLGYGSAMLGSPSYTKRDGWIISNGEYVSPVWFCPFCGEDLHKTQEERKAE